VFSEEAFEKRNKGLCLKLKRLAWQGGAGFNK